MGQEKYKDCIKYGCQTNLDESVHTVGKLRKSDEKVEFEDELHIEIRMEFMWQVDYSRSIIKDKYVLINQLEIKVQDLEE